jgi:alpha-amylase
VAAGYAYILTHPGLPSVFWDHYFMWGQDLHDRIQALIRLRHDLGINRASALTILKADNDRYAAQVDDKLVISLGGPGWEPGAGWSLKYHGESYAIWLKSN